METEVVLVLVVQVMITLKKLMVAKQLKQLTLGGLCRRQRPLVILGGQDASTHYLVDGSKRFFWWNCFWSKVCHRLIFLSYQSTQLLGNHFNHVCCLFTREYVHSYSHCQSLSGCSVYIYTPMLSLVEPYFVYIIMYALNYCTLNKPTYFLYIHVLVNIIMKLISNNKFIEAEC